MTIKENYLFYKTIICLVILVFLAIMLALPYFWGIAGLIIDVLICVLIYFLGKKINKDIVIGG